MARCADELGLPILGICRGAQALNVARGGTLHQHLPAVTDGSIVHRQTSPGWAETHHVDVAPDSRLASVLGARCWAPTPSTTRPSTCSATGLQAVAWAPDGTVEAIEAEGERFVVGVQWHAETLEQPDGPHVRLFKALVQPPRVAARLRAGRRATQCSVWPRRPAASRPRAPPPPVAPLTTRGSRMSRSRAPRCELLRDLPTAARSC